MPVITYPEYRQCRGRYSQPFFIIVCGQGLDTRRDEQAATGITGKCSDVKGTSVHMLNKCGLACFRVDSVDGYVVFTSGEHWVPLVGVRRICAIYQVNKLPAWMDMDCTGELSRVHVLRGSQRSPREGWLGLDPVTVMSEHVETVGSLVGCVKPWMRRMKVDMPRAEVMAMIRRNHIAHLEMLFS